jgi:hypothetical protein
MMSIRAYSLAYSDFSLSCPNSRKRTSFVVGAVPAETAGNSGGETSFV